MTITAKYPSRCATCSRPVAVGDRIEWSKGSSVRHADCSAAPATTATSTVARHRASRGTWTGCFCGSREIDGETIDSPRNCRSCRFEAQDF